MNQKEKNAASQEAQIKEAGDKTQNKIGMQKSVRTCVEG